jgi:hypothetical protein
VIPGLFIALLLRWDVRRAAAKAGARVAAGAKPYFYAQFVVRPRALGAILGGFGRVSFRSPRGQDKCRSVRPADKTMAQRAPGAGVRRGARDHRGHDDVVPPAPPSPPLPPVLTGRALSLLPY